MDDASQDQNEGKPAEAAQPEPTETTEPVSRVEAFIARGRAKMAQALADQPFRGSPDFADLLAVGEAMLRHLLEDHPDQDPEPPAAPDAEQHS